MTVGRSTPMRNTFQIESDPHFVTAKSLDEPRFFLPLTRKVANSRPLRGTSTVGVYDVRECGRKRPRKFTNSAFFSRSVEAPH